MPVLATGALFLVLSAFLASTVEMVEALTIVLAVGTSRQWRSTLIGVGVALVALAAVVAALGRMEYTRLGRTETAEAMAAHIHLWTADLAGIERIRRRAVPAGAPAPETAP